MTGHRSFSKLTDKFSPERKARTAAKVRALRAEMPLAELRQAREQSQKELARSLKVNQPAVAKLEKRTDMYVSNLRRYIEALGGSLEITARFSEGAVNITNFSDLAHTRSNERPQLGEDVMYDIDKLATPNDCRTVMARAKERGLHDVYTAIFKRYCTLIGNANDDPSDPMVRDFYQTLAAYEQLLTEKNGSTTIASRTRQKIANKGVHQSLIEWTRGKVETNGFVLLVEAGLPEFTGEYLVTKYANRFPEDVVALARSRLLKHNVTPAG